jgi:hypothetical protein
MMSDIGKRSAALVWARGPAIGLGLAGLLTLSACASHPEGDPPPVPVADQTGPTETGPDVVPVVGDLSTPEPTSTSTPSPTSTPTPTDDVWFPTVSATSFFLLPSCKDWEVYDEIEDVEDDLDEIDDDIADVKAEMATLRVNVSNGAQAKLSDDEFELAGYRREYKHELAYLHALEALPRCPCLSDGWTVSAGIADLYRTATYDDGYRVRGATGVFQLGVAPPAYPLGNGWSFDTPVNLYVPFDSMTKDYAKIRLNVAATIEAELRRTTVIDHHPFQFYGGVGIDIASESAGSSFPGFGYMNTQTMVGWSAELGARTPITKGLIGQLELDYGGLPSTRFDSPYGSYKLKEDDFSVGVSLRHAF